MRPLPILWKRLVNEGETCPRCGSTHQNVMAAIAKLEPALRLLGIQPVLESNRIWIGGKPMEEWLGASAGNSTCCDVCGDLPCRTMEVDGQTYEAIPEDLIVKAAIIAASRMIGVEPAATPSSCCSTGCGCN
jgi:hypothetical protein